MSGSSRIHVLSDLLVKKIAAGEVVERPASVVKELTENAVDAGATRIAVALEEGGRSLIRVSDNGCGMTPEELRLAVTPHATSKITSENDLFTIATMGFRGEALASISSVSKLRIASRPTGSDEGFEIQVAGEVVESSSAAGCAPGTVVEVRDLFFNVPARRKFLRGVSTEVGHVHEQLTRLALSHPSIGFDFTSSDRKKLNLPAGSSRLDRIARIYGPELAQAMMTVEREERGVRLEAYLSPPSQARATSKWQLTFVNGRYIRDRFLQHAIKEAYRGRMEPNRHGVVFLFITIDPANVDVNVHPTKIEVRWADSSLIHSQALSALRETLQRHDLTPTLRTDRAAAISEEQQDRIRREMAQQLKAMPPAASPMYKFDDYSAPRSTGGVAPSRFNDESSGSGGRIGNVWGALYGKSDAGVPASTDPGDRCSEAESPLSTLPMKSAGSIHRVVQMHNLYLVAETEDGIVIVDQHALHERIMYEQLRARFTSGPLESQRLLLPETLRVTPAQLALLERSSELLRQLGIELSAFGSDSVAIQSFPPLIKDTDVTAFMTDLIDLLERQSAETSADVVIDGVLSMMACKAAVKAGDALSPEEIDALFAQRELIDKPGSCPHGRPTMLRLTKADLDRQFHRT